MDSDTIYDVVTKLVGRIDPIGESHTDNERYKNLEVMVKLTDRLLTDVYNVAPNRQMYEYSRKKAGEYAKNALESFGDYCEVPND